MEWIPKWRKYDKSGYNLCTAPLSEDTINYRTMSYSILTYSNACYVLQFTNSTDVGWFPLLRLYVCKRLLSSFHEDSKYFMLGALLKYRNGKNSFIACFVNINYAVSFEEFLQ